LRRDGEGDAALQCAHAAYFAALAIGAESGLCAGIMTDVVRVEADLDNLRAALSWLLATGDPDTALRIAASLTEYWTLAGGQFSEGEPGSNGRWPAEPQRRRPRAQAAATGSPPCCFTRTISRRRAAALPAESLTRRYEIGAVTGMENDFIGLADLARDTGNVHVAAMMPSAAEAHETRFGISPLGDIAAVRACVLVDVAERLGEDACRRSWAEGHTLSLEATLAEALAFAETLARPTARRRLGSAVVDRGRCRAHDPLGADGRGGVVGRDRDEVGVRAPGDERAGRAAG
jgi:hypothetical protein